MCRRWPFAAAAGASVYGFACALAGMACEADGLKVAGVVSSAAADRNDVVDMVGVERAARSPQLAFVAVPDEDLAAYPLPCGAAGVTARLTGARAPPGSHSVSCLLTALA